MKKNSFKSFWFLSLIGLGLLVAFSFSYAAGQSETTWETASPEAAAYLEMAIDKMEEAIKTYQGANFPSRKLWAEAIEYGEKAIAAEPNFIEAHYYLAQIYQYTNWYYQEAIEWERYIELVENEKTISPEVRKKLAFAYYRLGYAAYERGDYEDCISYLRRAVEIDPQSIEAHYWLGRVFYEVDRLEDSLASWERVLDLNPFSSEAQYFYDKVKNCIEYGKEAYEHYEAGYKFYERGLWEKAIAEYQKAVQLNPHFSSAYHWLGRINYERGNYGEAARHWREVLRLEPQNKNAEYWLKQAEKQLKK